MLQITKEEIDTIIRLQDNEDKRKTIHRSLEELPAKFDRLAAEEADIEARLKNKEDYVEKQKKSYRECERELQAKQGKIQKSDAKLLSIKNNKEYQAVLAEIDEFKAKASALEDSMLSILDEIDAAEQALKSEKETSETEKKRIAEERQDLEAQQAEEEEKLARLDEHWQEISGRVSASLMNQYMEIKQGAPDGRAVAGVKNFVCQGCHMNIPPQMYNELCTTNVLRFCPFCSRIIYYNGNSQG